MFKKNDIITKGGFEKKVLEVHGDIVYVSYSDKFTDVASFELHSKLEADGWKLKSRPQERFKPEMEERYWKVDSDGNKFCNFWTGNEYDQARYALGNCFRTEADCDPYIEHLNKFLNP